MSAPGLEAVQVIPHPDLPSGVTDRGSLPGRESELSKLRGLLARVGPTLVTLHGPRESGKTALLRIVLESETALHFQASDLTPADLLEDFRAMARAVLGEAPVPKRPGVLPFPSAAGAWRSLLVGLVDRLEPSGERLVLVLDGMDSLLGARKALPSELAEMFESARGRNLPLCLILTARSARTLDPLTGPEGVLGPADLRMKVGPLPFRVAGWGHGGRNPRDAFRRWALLGDHPAHLPRVVSDEPLREAIVSRVLEPSGDLFDAPLRRLGITFQKPARYAAILRALAAGPLAWAGLLERTRGIDSGGQLAPYLRRLEEEGLVRADLPLDAKPGSRQTRYAVKDPFFAFWFGWVLPHRSLVPTVGAQAVWDDYISPHLSGHFQNRMEEAARQWLAGHAEEELGAAARETGALWGGEADFPVVGRLANGQVCYGMVRWEQEPVALPREMAARMKETRYGIGREARAPLFFLGGEADEELRRSVARSRLAQIVDLDRLMGGWEGSGGTDPAGPDRSDG